MHNPRNESSERSPDHRPATVPARPVEVHYQEQGFGGAFPGGAAPYPPNGPPPVGLGIADISFILFRHRWKIGILGLIGILAAIGYFLFAGSTGYRADAKLLVHYVIERSSVDPEDSRRLNTTGRANRAVMNAELQILRSQDIVREVVDTLGADRIVPEVTATDAGEDGLEGSDSEPEDEEEDPLKDPQRNAALAAVASGLEAGAAPESNIIDVSFRNQDPILAADVLNEVIRQYKIKHLSVRRPEGAEASIARDKEMAAGDLNIAVAEEQKLRKAARDIWPNGTMESIEAELALVKSNLSAAEVEFAELEARLKFLGGSRGVEEEKENAASEEPGPGLPERVVRDYRMLQTMLSQLNARQAQLLIDMTPQSSLVIANNAKIADTERQIRSLQEQYPGLAGISAPSSGSGSGGDSIASLKSRLVAIGARRVGLAEQLADLQDRANRLADVVVRADALGVTRRMKEESFRFYDKSYNQLRVDEKTREPAELGNITVIETPVTSRAGMEANRTKILLMLAGGGFAIGIGLAFLIEMFLDRTVKRAREVDGRLGLPLLMAIPRAGKRAPRAIKLLRNPESGEEDQGTIVQSAAEPWDEQHFVRPYAEAIRDRLEYYFELKGMTHNPKFIGITALDSGAGASTIAAGLAKAFSETGDGKVLLIDLNQGRTGVHPFFEGKPVCSINELLESNGKSSSRFKSADKDLFLATVSGNLNRNGQNSLESTNGNSQSFIPKQIYDLLPQFKISDFDHIIFELPPLGDTSPTVAMAGFMDKLLVVAESEKTQSGELKRQVSDLERNGADVSCLLNKVDPSMPKWLPS